MSVSFIKKTLKREGVRTYATNISWLFFAKIFTTAISFFVTAYVIRYLGPVQYGTLTFSLSMAAVFSFITDLGLEKIVSREFILKKTSDSKLLGTSIILKFIGAIIAMLVSSLVAILYIKDPTIKLYIIFANISLVLQPYSIINSYFQAKSKSKFPSILSIGAIVILSLSKVALIRSGASLESFIYITICEPLIYALGYLYIYRRYDEGSHVRWSFDRKLASELLRESWPLIFASAFSIIFIRIDQLIIQYLLGPREVGLYDAGVRVAEGWYFLPSIVTTALFPAIINSMKQGKDIFERRITHIYRLMYGMSLAIIIPIVLLAPWIVQILYGKEYTETTSIIQIYSWAGLFISVGIVIQQHLIAVNKSKYLLATTCVGAVSNILLNILFIPHYGIIGAAYATLFSYLLVPMSLLVPKNTRSEALFILKSFMFWGKRDKQSANSI